MGLLKCLPNYIVIPPGDFSVISGCPITFRISGLFAMTLCKIRFCLFTVLKIFKSWTRSSYFVTKICRKLQFLFHKKSMKLNVTTTFWNFGFVFKSRWSVKVVMGEKWNYFSYLTKIIYYKLFKYKFNLNFAIKS